MADENVDEATARIPMVKEQWAIQTKTKQRLRPPVENVDVSLSLTQTFTKLKSNY